MVGRHDMGTLYDEHMAFFGLGTALFHPNSASDMRPPCVGYLDASKRWNHVANIPFPGESKNSVYIPLEHVPQKMAELKIEWRPKTSLGVRSTTIAANAETPDGLPAGANASVRYSSKTNFGAILIAQSPVTLISYNDETLFRHWINENYSRLAQLHGVELSKYGLWLVTRTYTTPKASINAWQSKDKDAVISVKAKAEMMGDAGAEVSWADKSTDKDWTHHAAPEGVVAFFDGIRIAGWQWYWAGIKARVKKRTGLARRPVINRAGLGPQGSWHPGHAAINPSDPVAAPGADDAFSGSFSPILKENQRFVTQKPEHMAYVTDDKDVGLTPKHAHTEPIKHLSQASTVNEHQIATTDYATLKEEEAHINHLDEGAKSI